MQSFMWRFMVLASLAAETLSSEDVRFLIRKVLEVRQYNISNMNTYDTFPSNRFGHSVDFHLSKNLLFINGRHNIYNGILDSKLLDRWEVVNNAVRIQGFAVDWVHDRIYCAGEFLIHPTPSIISMDLNGGNESLVLRRSVQSDRISSMQIDPYHGTLFWRAGGIVESCELAGNNFQTNMSTTGVSVKALALDLSARRVYYVGRSNMDAISSLYSMNYEGGGSLEHFSETHMEFVTGLGLVRGQVYWVNYREYDENDLYMTSLQSTSDRWVKKLLSIDQYVFTMRVIHPDLQKRPKRDPCQDIECEYRCVTQNSGPLCECPEGQELEEDRTSCAQKHKEESVSSVNGRQDATDENEHTVRGDTSTNGN